MDASHLSSGSGGRLDRTPSSTLLHIFQVRRSLNISDMLERHKTFVSTMEQKRQAQEAEWGRITQVWN